MKNEDAKIIIGRKNSIWGCAVKHNVLLDNVLAGILGNGGEIILHTSPGSHTISLFRGKKVDSVISFHIPDGQKETYFFVTFGLVNVNITPLQSEMPQVKSANSKQKVCKTCGNQISKDSKTCPKCGAKNANTSHKILIALGVLLILGVIGSILPEPETKSSDNTPPSTSQQGAASPESQQAEPKKNDSAEQAIAISAKDLYDAYAVNQVNADSLYLDKQLMVTGTIMDITQDVLTNAPCIKLSVGDTLGIYAVDCFFPKDCEETSIIAGFVDGQVVTIFGECDGVALVDVQLSKCHL